MFLFPVLTLKIECSWPLVFEILSLSLNFSLHGPLFNATARRLLPRGWNLYSPFFSISLLPVRSVGKLVCKSCTTFISGQEFSSSVLICTEWNPNAWFLIAAFPYLLNNSQINSFKLPLGAPEQQGWFLRVFFKCLHSKRQQMSHCDLNFNEAV